MTITSAEIRAMAADHAAAWSSRSPKAVAAFYAARYDRQIGKTA